MENGVDDPDQLSTRISRPARSAITPATATPSSTGWSTSNRGRPTTRSAAIVWEIERKLAEAYSRPAIFYPVSAACWQPWFKGHTLMINSIYNGWRFEDAWLDR